MIMMVLYHQRIHFVSVGQVDNAWATKEVTGLPDTTNIDSPMVDNNWPENSSNENAEAVAQHVESLQGMNPLADVKNNKVVSAARKQFENRLQHLQVEVIKKCQDIDNLDDLEQIKSNILGKTGALNVVLGQFSQLPISDRKIVGELINNIIDQLKFEFEKQRSMNLLQMQTMKSMNQLMKIGKSMMSQEVLEFSGLRTENENLTKSRVRNMPQATTKISSALEEGTIGNSY